MQLSAGGGAFPAWSRTGRAIYYWRAGQIYEVTLDAAGRPALPRAVRHGANVGAVMDTSLDGTRLLAVKSLPESIPAEIRIVTNFADELKKIR